MTCESEPITLRAIGCAIRSATEEVFSVMLGMELVPGVAQMGRTWQGHTGVSHSGVVAVLGLTGAWGGSGQLSCESDFAQQIASKLLMSNYDSVDEEVLDAIEAGASAYLVASATADEVLEAVRRANCGEVLMPATHFVKAIARRRQVAADDLQRAKVLAQVTPRELDVLRLLAQGHDTASMAREIRAGDALTAQVFRISGR